MASRKVKNIAEMGGKVVTKSTARKAEKPKSYPVVDMDAISRAMDRQSDSLIKAINGIRIKAPDIVMEESKKRHVKMHSIKRNGQNRIVSAEFDIT